MIDWTRLKKKEDIEAEKLANYNQNQKYARMDAYKLEADPLFFKYQRGEIEKEEWVMKVEEIKARYPYIE